MDAAREKVSPRRAGSVAGQGPAMAVQACKGNCKQSTSPTSNFLDSIEDTSLTGTMLIRRAHQAVLDAPCLLAPSRPSPSLAAHSLRSITTVTTTSSSTAPDAPVRPFDAHSNPHAATPLASSILSPPAAQNVRRPSAFQLAVRRTGRLSTPPAPAPAHGPLPASVRALLPALAVQTPHYATVHIHERPYLVTEGDRVRLPFRMPGVEPGDVLRLTRAKQLGSRDFTLAGSPWVDSRLFVCRAVVAGVEAEPMRTMEKTKRRQRHIRKVRSKHRYTELVVQQLKVLSVEEVLEEEKRAEAEAEGLVG